MNRQDCFHTLQLHNHNVFNEQIDSIAQLKPYAFIDSRKSNLRSNDQTCSLKFKGDEGLVSTFKQAWTDCRVNLHGSADDLSTNRVSASASPRSSTHILLIVTSSVAFVPFVFASPGSIELKVFRRTHRAIESVGFPSESCGLR